MKHEFQICSMCHWAHWHVEIQQDRIFLQCVNCQYNTEIYFPGVEPKTQNLEDVLKKLPSVKEKEDA